MPRKDGKPTAAERKEAERLAGNEAFIAKMTDDELARAEIDFPLQFDFEVGDEHTIATVAAERRRRGVQ